MRSVMLFVAGLFVGLAVQVGVAQNANSGVVMMNHVGINVPDIAEAVTYYTQKMGYREAFRVNRRQGTAAAGLHADQQEHVSRAEPGERTAARRVHALRAPGRERGGGRREVQKERRDGERYEHAAIPRRSSPTSPIRTWAASSLPNSRRSPCIRRHSELEGLADRLAREGSMEMSVSAFREILV